MITNPTILAIDGATHKSGYAVYKDGKIIAHGAKQHGKTSAELCVRVNEFYDWLVDLANTYNITQLVVEGVYEDKLKRGGGKINRANDGGKTPHDTLMILQGYYMLVSWDMYEGAPIVLDPSEAKKFVGAYDYRYNRDQQKAIMVKAIQSYGYELTTNRNGKPSDDEADAIGLLLVHLVKNKLPITHPVTAKA